MMPKDHIEDIKNRYLNSDKEFVLPSLNRGIDRIEKAFPRYGSFLMEFIQNADDVRSTSMIIEIVENAIRVFNAGHLFSKEDVNSICRVGMSSKTPEDYIGYLGVGFKSVFLISESPEIHSGDYKFKFSKGDFSNPDRTPWQVIPLWIEGSSIALPSGHTTAFNIPFKEPALLKKLQEETKPEHISNRMLLFLKNLRNIEIIDAIQGTKRIIKRFEYSKTPNYEIHLIQEHLGEELKSQENWLIFRSICDVPAHVKNDHTTKEWEREGVDKREVVVAFRLDEKESLMIEERGTAHIGVFSFLPLKEVPSGLNFLIQADFLTTPGRTELARECLWNEWLAKEIYQLIIEKCIPVFMVDERWRVNFIEILYSPWGGHELFENNIKRPLRGYLEKESCLLAADGSTVKPNDAVIVNSSIKELIHEDDLKALYPDKKVLDPDCKIPWDIETTVKKGPTYNASSGVDSEMQRLLTLKTEQKDIDFFKKFYQELSEYAESTLRNSNFRYQNIILTDNWNLIDARTAYAKPHDLTIPAEVKENFEVLHPHLITDAGIKHALKILGVEELTTEHIQNILKTKEIPNIGKTWEALFKEEKIRKTKICKDLCDKHQIDIRDLGFLTLMSKSGEWLKPADLVFSKEYKPDHRIEELTEKGLLKVEDLSRLNIKFLSHEYSMGDDGEIKSWHDFFKELGLERNLDKEKIVQRIGITTALCFEEEKGRTARELPRSEEFGGYDIESNLGERLIEVKGRSDPSPPVWLTPSQHKKLQKEGEKYFLYVVRDALKNPVLAEIKGSKLLDVDYSISIDFYKWKNLTEEEFQP